MSYFPRYSKCVYNVFMDPEHRQPEANKLAKILQPFKRLFGKRIPDTNLQSAPDKSMNPEQFELIFQRAQQLAKEGHLGTAEKPYNVPVTETGGVYIEAVMELMKAQPNLNLSSLNEGDVVWWRDSADHAGYYAITSPYNLTERTYGRGAIKVELDDRTVQAPEARIDGASFGETLRMMHIEKNAPLEFTVISEGQSEKYMTHEITQFGVIKAEALKPA